MEEFFKELSELAELLPTNKARQKLCQLVEKAFKEGGTDMANFAAGITPVIAENWQQLVELTAKEEPRPKPKQPWCGFRDELKKLQEQYS